MIVCKRTIRHEGTIKHEGPIGREGTRKAHRHKERKADREIKDGQLREIIEG